MSKSYFLQDTNSTSEDSRQRAIRLESQNLRKDKKYSSAAILHAAMLVLGELGHQNAKKILKKIIDNPSIGDKLMELFSNKDAPQVIQMSRVEALSFLIHHDWSENDYRYVYNGIYNAFVMKFETSYATLEIFCNGLFSIG